MKFLNISMLLEDSSNFLMLSKSCKIEKTASLFAGVRIPASICLSINSLKSLFLRLSFISFNSLASSSLPSASFLNFASSIDKSLTCDFKGILLFSKSPFPQVLFGHYRGVQNGCVCRDSELKNHRLFYV